MSESSHEQPGFEDFRATYWQFFQLSVMPVMRRTLTRWLQARSDVLVHVLIRLSSDARFRAGELMYWMLRDVCQSASAPTLPPGIDKDEWQVGPEHRELAVALVASVELANFARLIRDDIVDEHDHRQHFRSLHIEFGSSEAMFCAHALDMAAMSLLDSVRLPADARTRLTGVFLHYQRNVTSSVMEELAFSANLPSSTRLPLDRYFHIMSAKHGLGLLMVEFLTVVLDCADGIESICEADREGLRNAAIRWDRAGAIYNDWSEIAGRRGTGWERVMQNRGARSEVEMGRPTIWHVFVSDLAQVPKIMQVLDTRILSLEFLLGKLHDTEMVTLLREFIRQEMERQLSFSVGSSMPRVSAYLSIQRERRMRSLAVAGDWPPNALTAGPIQGSV